MKVLTENDVMPIGEHKGKKLKNIPVEYWSWMWVHFGADYRSGALKKKQELIKVMDYINSIVNKRE